MIVRLALALMWCAGGAVLLVAAMLLAGAADAGNQRQPERAHACPPKGTPVDADGCPVHGPAGYDEGAMTEDQTAWPSRERVCARLAELCRAD